MNSNARQCTACSGAGAIPGLIPCSQCPGTRTTSTPITPLCSTCNGAGSYISTLPCGPCSGRAPNPTPTISSYFTFDGWQNTDFPDSHRRNVVRRRNVPRRRSVPHRRNITRRRNNRVRISTWIYAREVRAQVANAPAPGRTYYPNRFRNRERLPVQASAPLQHLPIVPGQTTAHTWDYNSGRWRAVYNDNNRHVIDVVYHDPNGRRTSSENGEFTLGHYHPAMVDSAVGADDQNMEDDNYKVGDDSEDPNSTEDVPMSGC